MTSPNIVSDVLDVLTEQSVRNTSSDLSRRYQDTKRIVFQTDEITYSNVSVIREQQKLLVWKIDRINDVEQLDEGILRTGSILSFLGKVKQYGNQVDTGVSKLKSLSSTLGKQTDEKERNKIMGQIKTVDSQVIQSIRKMIMYSSLILVSGLIGLDKSITKQMKKRRR